MTLEGIDWNADWARTLTLEEFVLRGILERKYAEYAREDQLALLKEAYRLCGGAVTPPVDD